MHHMRSHEVVINDLMQTGYRYVLTVPVGSDFAPEFTPELTPQEMLELGVFGGKYMTDCRAEFPPSWFERAKLSAERPDPSTASVWPPRSRCRAGSRKAGSTPTIPEAGFSGTAATTWAGAAPMTSARSAGGRRCAATLPRFATTACRGRSTADHGRGRLCCSGPTTAGGCKGVASAGRVTRMIALDMIVTAPRGRR